MRTGRRSWRGAVALVALVALAVAAAYEAAVALRWIAISGIPGRGAPGADAVAIVGVAALLTGLAVSLAGVPTPGSIPPVVRRVLPLGAAALVVATGLGFDPYYAPEHIRYPQNSGVPSISWLGVVGVVALGAVAIGLVHARAGLVVTAVLMLICLGTFVLTGSGH